jgi:hypothetical protein
LSKKDCCILFFYEPPKVAVSVSLKLYLQMAGPTPTYEVRLMGATPPHTDDSGYLTNTSSSADSLDSLPSDTRKLSQGRKCRYRNCAASTPGTQLSHAPSVRCCGAYFSVCKKRKASLVKLKLVHTPDSLFSSTEEKDSLSAVSKLPSQSNGEPLGSHNFCELSLLENLYNSQENGTLNNNAILYDEMEVGGNESVRNTDSKRDNVDTVGQKPPRESRTEYHHATDMAIPNEGCNQDSGTCGQEMANLYDSLKTDLSIKDYDTITNKHKMLTRDVSQDPPTKFQIFKDTTRLKIPLSLTYCRLKIPCQEGQEKVDFLYLLGERSNHHTVVKVILSYLEPRDLTAVVVVCKTWNRVCKSDRAARRRIHRYLKQKRDNKEKTALQVRRERLA